MPSPLAFRVEVTPERVVAAAPHLGSLLAWWSDAFHELRPARALPIAVLRWLGLGLSLLGVLLTGFLVATLPVPECPSAPSLLPLNAAIALFVLSAVLFLFLPRVTEALRGWARRRIPGDAARLCARLARSAPFTAEYGLAEGRLVAQVDRPRRRVATALRHVDRAAFSGDVAILLGARFPRLVRRIVWLPDDANERAALRAALGDAGVPVVDLPAVAPPLPAHG